MSCCRMWLSRKNAHVSPIDEYAAGIMIEMVHKVLANAQAVYFLDKTERVSTMGDTIWVDVQGRAKDDLPHDNSIMLRLKDELDRLSDKLGVPKLSNFYDYSVLAAQFAEEMDDGGDAEGKARPKEMWFDPTQALAAVRTIHNHLTQNRDDLGFKAEPSGRHWPANLMKELQNCQTVLEKTLSQGRQFRFLIVP